MKPNFGYMKIFAALLLALLTVFAPAVRDLHVLQHDCKTVENCPVCDFQFSEFFEAEVPQTPAPEFFYIDIESVVKGRLVKNQIIPKTNAPSRALTV